MKGIVGRCKVKRIDASPHFWDADDPEGTIHLVVAPRSAADREVLLALLREAFKNDSWVEMGGGAGSLVDSRTAVPEPLESERPALGPIVGEY